MWFMLYISCSTVGTKAFLQYLVNIKVGKKKKDKNRVIKNVPFLQTLIPGISLPTKIYQHAGCSFQISQPEVQ